MQKNCIDYIKEAEEQLKAQREHNDFFEYFVLILEKASELMKQDFQDEEKDRKPLTLV